MKQTKSKPSRRASLERKTARNRGEILTRTVELAEPQHVTATDKEVPKETFRERVAWLATIVNKAAQAKIDEVWSAKRVAEVTARGVPSHAYVAVEHCYGRTVWPPVGVHASSRVRRTADELAGRTLRSAARRLSILEALIPVWVSRAER